MKIPPIYEAKNNKTRTYGHSLLENLISAANCVKRGKSIRKAAEDNDVKKSTLVDFINKGTNGNHGGQTLFTETEETVLPKIIDVVVDWGFPIGSTEARLLARDLATKKGLKLNTFDGCPGIEWYRGFAKRNNMSERLASNMKSSRGSINADDISSYFDELEKLFEKLGDIPAANIYNYDKTNFTNDPGRSLVICRRGRKRAETVRANPKQAFSVMWCGSAAG